MGHVEAIFGYGAIEERAVSCPEPDANNWRLPVAGMLDNVFMIDDGGDYPGVCE
jgi:hypothetical protein